MAKGNKKKNRRNKRKGKESKKNMKKTKSGGRLGSQKVSKNATVNEEDAGKQKVSETNAKITVENIDRVYDERNSSNDNSVVSTVTELTYTNSLIENEKDSNTRDNKRKANNTVESQQEEVDDIKKEDDHSMVTSSINDILSLANRIQNELINILDRNNQLLKQVIHTVNMQELNSNEETYDIDFEKYVSDIVDDDDDDDDEPVEKTRDQLHDSQPFNVVPTQSDHLFKSQLINNFFTLLSGFEKSWREDFLNAYVYHIDDPEDRVKAMLLCPQVERVYLQKYKQVLESIHDNKIVPRDQLEKIYDRLGQALQLPKHSRLGVDAEQATREIQEARDTYLQERRQLLLIFPELEPFVKTIQQVELEQSSSNNEPHIESTESDLPPQDVLPTLNKLENIAPGVRDFILQAQMYPRPDLYSLFRSTGNITSQREQTYPHDQGGRFSTALQNEIPPKAMAHSNSYKCTARQESSKGNHNSETEAGYEHLSSDVQRFFRYFHDLSTTRCETNTDPASCSQSTEEYNKSDIARECATIPPIIAKSKPVSSNSQSDSISLSTSSLSSRNTLDPHSHRQPKSGSKCHQKVVGHKYFGPCRHESLKQKCKISARSLKKSSKDKKVSYKILTRGKTLEDFIHETDCTKPVTVTPLCPTGAPYREGFSDQCPQNWTTSNSLSIKYVGNNKIENENPVIENKNPVIKYKNSDIENKNLVLESEPEDTDDEQIKDFFLKNVSRYQRIYNENVHSTIENNLKCITNDKIIPETKNVKTESDTIENKNLVIESEHEETDDEQVTEKNRKNVTRYERIHSGNCQSTLQNSHVSDKSSKNNTVVVGDKIALDNIDIIVVGDKHVSDKSKKNDTIVEGDREKEYDKSTRSDKIGGSETKHVSSGVQNEVINKDATCNVCSSNKQPASSEGKVQEEGLTNSGRYISSNLRYVCNLKKNSSNQSGIKPVEKEAKRPSSDRLITRPLVPDQETLFRTSKSSVKARYQVEEETADYKVHDVQLKSSACSTEYDMKEAIQESMAADQHKSTAQYTPQNNYSKVRRTSDKIYKNTSLDWLFKFKTNLAQRALPKSQPKVQIQSQDPHQNSSDSTSLTEEKGRVSKKKQPPGSLKEQRPHVSPSSPVKTKNKQSRNTIHHKVLSLRRPRDYRSPHITIKQRSNNTNMLDKPATPQLCATPSLGAVSPHKSDKMKRALAAAYEVSSVGRDDFHFPAVRETLKRYRIYCSRCEKKTDLQVSVEQQLRRLRAHDKFKYQINHYV